MSSEMAGETRAGARRWLMPVLVGSLMLNMLFVGLAAGRFIAHRDGHYFGERHRGGGLKPFFRSLPDERRTALREMLLRERDEVKPLREEVRRLRREMRDAIAREPYDAAAVAQAMARINEARAKVGERIGRGLVDLIAQMTPEERRKFSQHAMQRGRDRDD